MPTEHHYRYAARIDSLTELTQQVGACALACGLEQPRLPALELVLEEAFVNICNHAYQDDNGAVEVFCSSDGGRLVVELIDYGQPFDSFSRPDPQLDQSLAERQPGGLGIYLIRKMTDDYSWQRRDQANILTLIFNLPESDQILP